MSSSRHPLLDVILLFTRLGCTAFGGPAAHVALIEVSASTAVTGSPRVIA